MTDRYDNLLLKARAEVLGKHTLRAELSTDAVFEAVWDGLQKGLWGGARRGYKENRRPLGQQRRTLDTQREQDIYRQGMQRPMAQKPKLAASREDVPLPVDAVPLPVNAVSRDDTGVQEPPTLGLPKPIRSPIKPTAELRPITGKTMRPVSDSGSQAPPSAFDQAWDAAQKETSDTTEGEKTDFERLNALQPGSSMDMTVFDNKEEPLEVDEKREPTLTESGMGSRKDDWNPRTQNQWGPKSGKGMAAAEYYASLEANNGANAGANDMNIPGTNEPDPLEQPKEATVEAGVDRSRRRKAARDDNQTALDLFADADPDVKMGKKSNDAFNSAWSVLKDPFANPFDNPQAFATHDDFRMSKEKEGPKRRLPEDDDQPSDKKKPVRGPSEDGADGAYQIPPEDLGDLAGSAFNPNWQQENKSADTSLLPQGMLKQVGQQQVSADYSLLPQGWREEVVN